MAAPPGIKVTDIALRLGFTHFRRFAEIRRARDETSLRTC